MVGLPVSGSMTNSFIGINFGINEWDLIIFMIGLRLSSTQSKPVCHYVKGIPALVSISIIFFEILAFLGVFKHIFCAG